ncbi:MAG: methylated-DNA--[Oscillospiraceae bacterium]|nr:methylated-DNA--[protein]-cysteine S-methyltransferase [Oscillospiraceae bacterium]
MDYITRYPSPVGMLTITSDGEAITGLWMDGSGEIRDDLPVLVAARNWLDRYFRGERPAPKELPLSPAGTDFQKQVWGRLLEVPYGETRSYGDIARAIGKPRACQAVGQAVGRNRIAIIIPCHRIIGADGSLTGFAGGLNMKRKLLNHEQGCDHF